MSVWDSLRAAGTNAAKVAVLNQAGTALHDWLMAEALSADQLRALLDAGVPVLTDALQRLPPEAVGTARRLAGGVLARITPDDYPVVLQQLAGYPETAAHAHLLAEPLYYHRDFVPAMTAARAWLAG